MRTDHTGPDIRNSAPASPCINVCVMDDERGLCGGCNRTLDEIANWTNYSRGEKLAVLEKVALRKAASAAVNNVR